MSPPVVSVVIKCRDWKTSGPKMGQRVRVEGREGVFVVVRLDRSRRIADLMQAAGTHAIEHELPFDSIRPLHGQPGRNSPLYPNRTPLQEPDRGPGQS